jgi:hypothetical protein
MYALFKDGKMISKPHSTQDACAIEAYERGLVVRMAQVTEAILVDGVTIGDLKPKEQP